MKKELVGFVKGTPILMANGDWKPIEEIKIGDEVMSFATDSEDSALVPQKVVDTLDVVTSECLEVHNEFGITTVAKNQLFFTPGAGWMPAYETAKVMTYNGLRSNVQVRKAKSGKYIVRDITVDKNHSLVANGIRVHNGGGKKRVAAPEPVVTAGKPGRPVSVTTTYNGNTTTVVVNSPPGYSGQISVSNDGVSTVRTNSVPGLPLYPAVTVPSRVIPYPSQSAINDRVVNSQYFKDEVCNAVLAKGDLYRITSSDQNYWDDVIGKMVSELSTISSVNMYKCGSTYMTQDKTIVNDAINQAYSLKSMLRAGYRINYSSISSMCSQLTKTINRINNSTGSTTTVVNQTVTIAESVNPAPESYYSDRVYDADANYPYMIKLGRTSQFIFDPPNAPAIASVRYYKHWDSVRNVYYFDRISENAVA